MSTASATVSTNTMAEGINATAQEAPKVKPCCVCKDEKAERDDCMLFSKSDDPQRECQNLVSKYKSCMAGFGFQIP